MSYGLCSLARGMWNPKPRNLWRISKYWRYYEGIWKEYEDKDGGGSIQEISRLEDGGGSIQDRWWKFVMESLEANILSEDIMKMSSNTNGSI